VAEKREQAAGGAGIQNLKEAGAGQAGAGIWAKAGVAGGVYAEPTWQVSNHVQAGRQRRGPGRREPGRQVNCIQARGRGTGGGRQEPGNRGRQAGGKAAQT